MTLRVLAKVVDPETVIVFSLLSPLMLSDAKIVAPDTLNPLAIVVVPEILVLFFTSKLPEISAYRPYRLDMVKPSLLLPDGVKLIATLLVY